MSSINVSNEEFLRVLFGDEWHKAHVTAFSDDPSAIPNERRALCWGGGFAKDRLNRFTPEMNQYFTISLFSPEDQTGRAVRRIRNFDACFVIVADDVKEKLPLESVERLPAPTYKMLSSEGSEQWGWVLDEACEDKDRVNNLLDGLVTKGLAPDGKDPGMKGVTRYVRLPGGSNTKKKRLINGTPFKCCITEWNPNSLHSLQSLADEFGIDLNAPNSRSDNAMWLNSDDEVVTNHPVLKQLEILGFGNEGWIQVVCPNIEQHSDADDSGSAVQIQANGQVFFQCHHGHCNGESSKKITGKALVQMLDDQKFNGSGELKSEYNLYVRKTDAKLKIDLQAKLAEQAKKQQAEERGQSSASEDMEEADRPMQSVSFAFDPMRYVFMPPENKFYDIVTGLLIQPKGLDNRYLAQFPRAGGKAMCSEAFLMQLDKNTSEADAISWIPTGAQRPPREELISDVDGKRMINTWPGFSLRPKEGDVSLWLDHAEYLIPDKREREVVLDYLACMVQRVAEKPAFFLGHRGSHRVGKDLFYKPLMQALGYRISRAVEIDNILNGWGDYLHQLKFVVVTEVDKAQDKRVANSMKTITAPTASGYRVLNMKGGKVIEQLDCMGGVMMSNKRNFIAIEEGDRRYFIVDSWVEPREASYYKSIDTWYREQDGYRKVLNYLLQRDISHFNHNQLPYMTKGAEEMVKAGRYDYEQDLEEMIADRLPPFQGAWASAKHIKQAVKENGLKCGNNGLEEALRSLGWFKFRGQKREEGELKSTQTFFTNQLEPDAGLREAYDFFVENR